MYLAIKLWPKIKSIRLNSNSKRNLLLLPMQCCIAFDTISFQSMYRAAGRLGFLWFSEVNLCSTFSTGRLRSQLSCKLSWAMMHKVWFYNDHFYWKKLDLVYFHHGGMDRVLAFFSEGQLFESRLRKLWKKLFISTKRKIENPAFLQAELSNNTLSMIL